MNKQDAYDKDKLYFGDLHNHCGISYGHGPLDDALANARLQLDFVSVTGHAFWPDMPAPVGHLKAVVDYHVNGFNKLERGWHDYTRTMEEQNDPGRFVTLPSYEMHSVQHGDYVIYSRDPLGPMVKPDSFEELQDFIRDQRASGDECFIVPHHIGYARGYRGINWDSFHEEVSPLVEILSMHGCAESDACPVPYLHTMGPRNGSSTMQGGLARGHHFSVIGSTDHHSAHPGSYGYGAAAVWARELTREGIWEALKQGRTYAVTGDRIALQFSVNDEPMGSILPFGGNRDIRIDVKGSDSLDRIEIIKNNRVLKRFDFPDRKEPSSHRIRGKIKVTVGWGEKGVRQDWDVCLAVRDGDLCSVEPQFHGVDVVDPEDKHRDSYRFTEMIENSPEAFRFKSSTWGNVTTTSDSNQAVVVEVEGNRDSALELQVNEKKHIIPFSELLEASQSHYLGDFLTGAYHIGRLIPEEEYVRSIRLQDQDDGSREDVYYVRVGQRNNQWAWSSPVWIAKGPAE